MTQHRKNSIKIGEEKNIGGRIKIITPAVKQKLFYSFKKNNSAAILKKIRPPCCI